MQLYSSMLFPVIVALGALLCSKEGHRRISLQPFFQKSCPLALYTILLLYTGNILYFQGKSQMIDPLAALQSQTIEDTAFPANSSFELFLGSSSVLLFLSGVWQHVSVQERTFYSAKSRLPLRFLIFNICCHSFKAMFCSSSVLTDTCNPA